MLSEIRIESLGAISAATAEFDRGLTVLTGETGTGKTMVVTSLHLLGGARADATRVRSGSDRAVVEGRFSTIELGEDVTGRVEEILESSGAERDDDGSVIAARSVSRAGPSRAYLGGRSVPAKSLSNFTAQVLTLHGQNDQLRLMRPDEQRAALDRFAEVDKPLARYRSMRDEWLTARRDLADRRRRARELAQEADRLSFGIHEIDAVAPEPGEDEAIIADIRRLSELDALREAAQTARFALAGELDEPTPESTSAADGVGRAQAALESTDDSTLQALAVRLAEAMAVIGDVSGELGHYLSELPSDASTLETKLARQAELRTLTRKYAADIDGVLAWSRDAAERLVQLDVSEESLAALDRKVAELEAQVVTAAVELTKARSKAAKGLAKAVTAELAGLAMANAVFTIGVAPMPARADDSAPLTMPDGEVLHAGHDGVDAVEFGFTAHRGADVLPLAKSASGGELSRVMLALEVVLSASTAGTTMVFDEVDAGVGGRAAVQIGRRLARLARTHQVIVVTHLPQVAAFADAHLVVDSGNGRAKSSGVRRIDDEDRVAELARMLAGLGESDSGRAHARELLEAAQQERSAP
ncbi:MULTISPECIES: DNA repair protein RecN [Mycolicibacterium]|uniref:DNA repair protein RecN n=1 Tax=Mycolicibacterium senegalense TaxID=1796 RepID=A0A378T2X9_9MYCO|nr:MULTISPECIES: DNA repair protein RecN [Mycolicibacterium]MCV7338530.1 DNA repair protein RecN [Mycolicibacterium senegalense]MDR7290402.1 DNA repair protein RecN (Recombination protein N) [Mycolicibacterium senegalense]QZA22004.1 DNA repair protein RecN [Mycolicibacterium senegalense]CDP81707.1 DNA repair protein RecN [Mycolicibacterium farcinogenes]STZ54245.1 DNA repair protein recN [Mycolicibacterium senegalense]